MLFEKALDLVGESEILLIKTWKAHTMIITTW
jgi:hypothetical protein